MQLSAMATQPSAGQQGGTGGAKAETGVGRGGKGGGGGGGHAGGHLPWCRASEHRHWLLAMAL